MKTKKELEDLIAMLTHQVKSNDRFLKQVVKTGKKLKAQLQEGKKELEELSTLSLRMGDRYKYTGNNDFPYTYILAHSQGYKEWFLINPIHGTTHNGYITEAQMRETLQEFVLVVKTVCPR